jgi:fructooligosaccharide transport system substrate-binding protein
VAISTPPQVTKYNETAIRLPTLKSVQQDIPMFQKPPFDMQYQQLEEWGQPRPLTTAFSQYNVIVARALKDIAYGSDPKQRLDEAVQQLDPILAKAK